MSGIPFLHDRWSDAGGKAMSFIVCLAALLMLARASAAGQWPAPEDWARADQATVRLEPAAFPDMPLAVREELQRRGCTIPQAFTNKRPHNAVRGRFSSATERDWAVLCSRQRTSSILVFRAGSPTAVTELARRADADFLQVTGPKSVGYSRAIGVASPQDIRKHRKRFGGPKPPPLDHDGIDDMFVEKASVVWYWDGKRWLQLSGADCAGAGSVPGDCLRRAPAHWALRGLHG